MINVMAVGPQDSGKTILLEAALIPLAEMGVIKIIHARGRSNFNHLEEVSVEILDMTKLLQLSGRV